MKNSKGYQAIYNAYKVLDIGAAHYYGKTINRKHYGSNNLLLTPVLNNLKKALESDYRDFITENKPFLLDNNKAIQRSIEAYNQKRLDAVPKTYDEWEEKVLNQFTEALDTTVYCEDVDDDPLRSLDILIASLELV